MTRLLIVIAIIAVLIINSRLIKDYLAPVKVFEYFWGVQLILCILLFGNTVTWKYSGMIWIILLFFVCSIFAISTINGKNRNNGFYHENHLDDRPKYSIDIRSCNTMLIIFIIIGVAYAVLLVRRYGFTIKNLFDLNTLLQMNNTIAVKRYGGASGSVGTLSKILLIFVYAAPMCGGYSFVFAKDRKDKIIATFTLVPELLVLFAENTKAAMIACAIFWVSGWLVANMAQNERIGKFRLKTILILVGLFIVLIALLMVTMMLRVGSLSVSTFSLVQNKIGNYIFGHIPAFDNWFDSNLFSFDFSYGMQTFVGVFSLLGISTRTQGVYQDNYIGGALATNVYSYFRGIVSDFGVIGGQVFFVLLICIATWAYKQLRDGKVTITNQVILMIVYSFIFFFPVSMFSYNSFIFAFVIFVLFVAFVSGKIRVGNTKMKIMRIKFKY